MPENIQEAQPAPYREVFLSRKNRAIILTVIFIFLAVADLAEKKYGPIFDYIYIIVISLSGFWFGSKGGIAAAAAASVVFLVQTLYLQKTPGSDMMPELYLIVFLYFSAGVILGVLSDQERKMRERLRDMAGHDELTGCVNFRWIVRFMEKEISRARRYRKEMTVVMLDIDGFKDINDTYGHVAGNIALQNFSNALKDNFRREDVVGRYGGDEFMLVLPESSAQRSLKVLERIKSKISSVSISSSQKKGLEDIPLRFSAGVASYPVNGENIHELVCAADNALYQAKRDGKDRVILERRRWVRFKPVGSVKAEFVHMPNRASARDIDIANISKRGMLVLLPEDSTEEEEFLCRIYFPGEPDPREFKCRIIHKEKAEGELFLVGVYFVDMPAGFQEKLKNYVRMPELCQ
jgi:diguanylate cyclase (GGDEF)-like protein